MKQHKITWASVKEHPQGAIEFLVESNRIEGIGDEGSALRCEALLKFGYAGLASPNIPIPCNKLLPKHEYNSMRALKFVVKHYHEDLTIEKILKLHAIQMDGTMPIPRGKKRRFKAGVFREQPVYVNRKEKPEHTRIPMLINDFVKDSNFDDGLWKQLYYSNLHTHYHFECIHPFIDGNGRVGRLLWLWLQLKHYGVIKPILDAYAYPGEPEHQCFQDRRKSYYREIREYEKAQGWVSESEEATLDRYTQEALLYIQENSTSRRSK